MGYLNEKFVFVYIFHPAVGSTVVTGLGDNKLGLGDLSRKHFLESCMFWKAKKAAAARAKITTKIRTIVSMGGFDERSFGMTGAGGGVAGSLADGAGSKIGGVSSGIV